MIWILMVPIVFYLTFQDLSNDSFLFNSNMGFLDWVDFIVIGTFVSLLISIIPLSIGIFVGTRPKIYGEKSKERELVTLRNKDGFSGQGYFLGIGYITDKQYYFWYVRDDDGAIRGGKTARSEGVDIHETQNIPKMVSFRKRYYNEFWEKYLWLLGLDTRSDDVFCPRFYIPKNSIQENFTL